MKSIRLPKGKEKSGATSPVWPLELRSTESLETLYAFGLDHHELDGCATRESREAKGESQPDPHALPGAIACLRFGIGANHNTWALLMTVSSQRG